VKLLEDSKARFPVWVERPRGELIEEFSNVILPVWRLKPVIPSLDDDVTDWAMRLLTDRLEREEIRG
jgi:hypothetical protein